VYFFYLLVYLFVEKRLKDPQDGFLVERRLHRRMWKWAVHGAPENQRLSSLTPIYDNTKADIKVASLFFATTSTGYVFQYQHPIRLSGMLKLCQAM
jgi:hypothetical protein